jgi:hypothetical protein
MTDPDDELEFLPGDELTEREPGGAEDEAMHSGLAEELWELLAVEADEFDAEVLDEDEADELELRIEPDEPAEAAEADGGLPAAGAAARGEREEDVQEVMRRHYGLVSEEPDEDLAREDEVPAAGDGEFVCRSCLLRRPASQLADPARGTCLDCAATASAG